MKTETMIFDVLRKVLPEQATKTVLFASVGQTSYGICFFSLFEGATQYQQCFQLSEMGMLDENELDAAFKEIADLIEKDSRYKSSGTNIYTLVVDGTGVKMNCEYYDKSASAYKIKKAWKEMYLL